MSNTWATQPCHRHSPVKPGLTPAEGTAITIAIPEDVLDQIAERVAAIVVERLSGKNLTWLDEAGAAEYLCLPAKTVGNLGRAGALPRHVVGRRVLYNVAELDEWVRAA